MVDDLVDSINLDGLWSKLVLRPMTNGSYEVLSGWRRKLALTIILGEDAEFPKEYYVVKDVSDFEAIRISISENVHRVNLSPIELANAARELKTNKPKISAKEIAHILWTSEARVKRLLEMNDSLEFLPDSAVRELSTPEEMEPTFTDAHVGALMKANAFDLGSDTIKDVCEFIMTHDVPASKVKSVVDKFMPKDEHAPAADPAEPKKADDGKMQDAYKGTLTLDSEGLIMVEGRKGSTPLDLTYYKPFVENTTKFRVFLNAKITIKPLADESDDQ
jgi:ParB/RepB/Spo0J family partition protein